MVAIAKRSARARRRMRPVGRALFLVAFFLMASGLLRLGTNVGGVLADQTAGQPEAEEPNGKDEDTAPMQESEVSAVLDALTKRENRLEQREAQLEQRLQDLAAAEARIEHRLSELKAAETELKRTIDVADGASERDLETLTAVYENMKSKDASVLFEEMDPDFSAGFLARMKPEAAAGIMAGLSAERAYSISAILAGRSALGPKN
ncbi:MAG: MgtE intracellular N domain [Rhodobacteraceae bacterium HLUCCO07]|nr:MAG: MgtE intracellular N domain [Rhodobacteraceae bacterium HLUCCO07]